MSLGLILLISPFLLQAGLTFFDEFYYHHKRGLPMWEKIGHPLDTLTVLACYGFVILNSPSTYNLQIFIALALFSSLFITKDEFVHAEECPPTEQWLHSVLFVIHPIALITLLFYWFDTGKYTFISTQEHILFKQFIHGQVAMISLFLTYQVLYWSIPWKKIFSTNSKVNNEYYHGLGEEWHTASDDPIALLRAESQLKNPWVLSTINEQLDSKSKTVLDIGCGAGFLSNAMAKSGHKVSGIDMSTESLEIAKKYDVTKSAIYQTADAYSLPFENQSFDVVCAMDFLEHVEDPSKVIEEASRVLKPGGIFFFHTFSKNLLAYIVIIKLVEWFLPKTPKNMHILRLFISPKQLKKMCALSQLKTKHVMGIRPNFEKAAFWKSLLRREVDAEFSFSFTKSTMLSYIGYAQKGGA